jgi:hypothetical protein
MGSNPTLPRRACTFRQLGMIELEPEQPGQTRGKIVLRIVG